MAYGNSFQRTTPIVLNLIIINVLAYFASAMFNGGDSLNSVYDLFALHHYKSSEFRPYQVITHMFMHGGLFHLLFNMLGLWMFGTTIEKVWGPKRFLIFYLICGLGAAFTQLASYAFDYHAIDQAISHGDATAMQIQQYQTILRMNATVGASGAIMGVLVAFGYLFPNTQLFVMPIPFPIKAKWAIMGFIAFDIFGGITKVPGDNIAHFAHVGGALVGFLIVLYWNKKNKQTFY